MKTKIDAIIVVEGKSDVAFLDSFIEADFVITGGSAVNETLLTYLKTLSQKRTIVVLTDPDYPGLQIRKVLDEHIPHLQHVHIRKEQAIKHHKVGVAESNQEEVLQAIKAVLDLQKAKPQSDLDWSYMYQEGWVAKSDSARKREQFAHQHHLGFAGNGKQFLKKLRALGFTRDELKRFIEEEYHDC